MGDIRHINLWNVATGEHTKTLTGHEKKKIYNLTFSPEGTILASADDRNINLWDVATGEHIRRLTARIWKVTSLAFSPDGTILASGGYRDSYPDDYMHIHLWDVATGEHIKKFIQRTGQVTSLAFSPDGTILASGGYGSTNLWDVATGEHIRVLKGPKDWRWTVDLAFSPDGTTLAGGYTRDIDRIGRGVLTGSLWNVATGEHIRMFTAIHKHTSHTVSFNTYRVLFNTDGATLASADRARYREIVILWDLDAAPLLQGEIPEDVNGDGVLNIQDLVFIAANFGQTGLNAADVNGDGIVDIRDLVKVASAIAAAAAAPLCESTSISNTHHSRRAAVAFRKHSNST